MVVVLLLLLLALLAQKHLLRRLVLVASMALVAAWQRLQVLVQTAPAVQGQEQAMLVCGLLMVVLERVCTYGQQVAVLSW